LNPLTPNDESYEEFYLRAIKEGKT